MNERQSAEQECPECFRHAHAAVSDIEMLESQLETYDTLPPFDGRISKPSIPNASVTRSVNSEDVRAEQRVQ